MSLTISIHTESHYVTLDTGPRPWACQCLLRVIMSHSSFSQSSSSDWHNKHTRTCDMEDRRNVLQMYFSVSLIVHQSFCKSFSFWLSSNCKECTKNCVNLSKKCQNLMSRIVKCFYLFVSSWKISNLINWIKKFIYFFNYASIFYCDHISARGSIN